MTITGNRVREKWRPVHQFKGSYLCSNAGRVAKIDEDGNITKIIAVYKGPRSFAELTDGKGRKHSKNLKALIETTFGRSPIRPELVILDPPAERPNTKEERARIREEEEARALEKIVQRAATGTAWTPAEIAEINAEYGNGDAMTIQSESLGLPVEHVGASGTGNLDADIQELSPIARWVDIHYPPSGYEDIRPGYTVSELGEMRSPGGTMLAFEDRNGYLSVSLARAANSLYSGYARVRLDMIVCESFHGPRPSPLHGPRHLNDDHTDCTAENLVWEVGYAPNISRKRPQSVIKAEQGLIDGQLREEAKRVITQKRVIAQLPEEAQEEVAERLAEPEMPPEVTVSTTTTYTIGPFTAIVAGETVTVYKNGDRVFESQRSELAELAGGYMMIGRLLGAIQ